MDFSFNEEQKILRRTVHDILQKEVAPTIDEAERKRCFPVEQMPKLGKLGFWDIYYPEEYGGTGAGMVTQCMVSEEMGQVSLGWADLPLTVPISAKAIANYGSEQVKRKYLPKIVKGEWLVTFGVSEPSCGSDIGSMKTIAVRDGDNYIINGSKTFIPFLALANSALIVATMDPSKRSRGLTMFLVDCDTPAYSFTPLQFTGVRFSGYGTIFLDNCRVPGENLIGEEQGFIQVAETLSESRVRIAAALIGGAQGAFNEAFRYAQERTAFGRPISEFQEISSKLADAATDIEAARWMTYHAAWLWDQGAKPIKESAMAKLYANEMALRVTDQAARIMGAYAVIEGSIIDRHYRDVRSMLYGDGTPEIQRITINREMGLWKKH